MRKPKVTDKLIKQMLELRHSRNNIEHYNFNFLINISRYAALIHRIIEIRLEEELFKVAVSQYLVCLVSCWETFFRDTFLFITSNDEDFRKKISSLVGIKSDALDENLYNELLSKYFNFQNFDDIESSFSPIFVGNMFFTITNYVFPHLGINGQIAGDFCYESVFPNSLDSVKQVYEERHKIVHDANYRHILHNKFVQQIEATFIIFPQIFTIWMSEKYNLPLMATTINVQNSNNNLVEQTEISVPYLFTIKEMLSTDLEIVSESN